MAYQRPKGTNDFLGDEGSVFDAVVSVCGRVARTFGFEPVYLPVLESTELFARGIGAETDVVAKEMWTFPDRKGRSMTLRPEGTAGVVRAYLQNGLQRTGVRRFSYAGPFFRYERPQAGRYRQFHQFGVELLGDPTPASDVETVDLFCAILQALDLPGLAVEINSVGCPACRPAYAERLRAALEGHAEELCGDCRRRLATNPLRVLDCKEPGCGPILAQAPVIIESLCEGCAAHHAAVTAGLRDLGASVRPNPRLVRGLDYYTRTAFEVTCTALGAQNAVGGGGRYDGLVQELGGPATPATGFAIGLERLTSLLPEATRARLLGRGGPLVAVAAEGEGPRGAAMVLAGRLRRRDVRVLLDHGTARLGKQLGKAAKAGAAVAIVLGQEEFDRGTLGVKNLGDGTQRDVARADLGRVLVELGVLSDGEGL